MSRGAVAESFFEILKSEMVSHVNYYSILQAKTQIFEFIEVWYNRKRKHAYLGYKHPMNLGKIIIQNALNYLSIFLLQVQIVGPSRQIGLCLAFSAQGVT
ncbi:IS3 family transposase [Reichenbachiella agarivorans]|uniref:IS3 family transposase n=1 Tax=Reichenbachiella agarivorans TaxID=2979464 RepID=UPI00389A56E9